MDKRLKTDIRITEFLVKQVNEVTSKLGISKNAFYNLAVVLMLGIVKTCIVDSSNELWKKLAKDFKKYLSDNF